MQVAADAVPHELLYDRKAVLYDVGLHRSRDVAHAPAFADRGDPLEEALLRDCDELFRLRADGADREGRRAVSMIALVERADINLDDVALLQDSAARDAMDHLVVDADTGRRGKAVVTEEGWRRTVRADAAFDLFIDLRRRRTRADMLAADHPGQRSDPSRVAHALQFRFRFNRNHNPSAFLMHAAVSSTGRLPGILRTSPLAS